MTIGVVQSVGAQTAVSTPKHTSQSATLPGAPTAGNILVLWCMFSDAQVAIQVPAGWTSRHSQTGEPGALGISILVATKVVCPGDSATVTVTCNSTGARRSNLHVVEVNGGYGGITSNRQTFGTSHYFPAITPTGGAEALLVAGIVNENAYGVSSGPGGGYTYFLGTTSNDGASDQALTYSQHVASASGSYGGSGLPIVYSSGCVTEGFQVWFKAALDSAPCLGPVADFSGTPVSGRSPLTVAFTDASTGSPTSWLWDFGDGYTSTQQNPSHVYTAIGDYTVSLTASNVDGDDTLTKVDYIRVRAALINEVYELVPPGDSIVFVGNLDEARDKAFRPVRNEPGSGSFTVNRYSPEATATILKPGNLVRCIVPEIDPNAIFAWFMEKGDFKLVSSNEQGGEDITIGGRGVLSYWDRAIWLSEKFVVPWWPDDAPDPPAGAIGMLRVAAGRYAFYDVGLVSGHQRITDQDFVTVGAFDAYYDRRRTYLWPVSEGGPGGFKRRLVRFMSGEPHDTRQFHPTQDGVTDFRASYAIGNSVLLSDISPDTPGAVLYRLYQEGTDPDRPTQPIPLMTIDFDETTDSNGDPWATTDALAGLTAELGETYLDTIVKLLSTGVIDVEMGPDLDMHAYNAQGRDLTGTTFGAGKVRFVKGVNIADELHRERDDNPVATFIEVVGLDNNIGRAVLPDAASRVAREVSGTGESDDDTVLEAIGLASLNARLIKSDAIGFRIATGDDDATGLYLPGPEGSDNGDFWLGDVTTLHTGTGEQDFDNEDERVFAITIAEDEAGNLEATPEVGSVLGEAERRLYANTSARSVSFTVRDVFSDTEVAENGHPDLEAHDELGLATDAELAAHTGDTVDAHAASAISFTPNGSIAATDVQAAIQEVRDEASGGVTVQDEGTPLATTGTTLNFVGAGVAASGTGATKTITVSGGSGSVATDAIFDAKGDLPVGTGADTAAKLSVGTDGLFLKADSAQTTGLVWAAGGSGALVLLEQHTASSSATLDFTTFISSTYDEYVFEFVAIRCATDNTNFFAQVGTGGGPTYGASNMSLAAFRNSHAGTAVAGNAVASPTGSWNLSGAGGQDNAAASALSGTMRIYGPQSGVAMTMIGQTGYVDNAGANINVALTGLYNSTTVVTAMNFLFAAGNITSGIIRVYGIVK